MRYSTKTLKAPVYMSTKKSWLKECDDVQMAMLCVKPKVDTQVRSPNIGGLPCPNVDIDGVASPIHWHFVEGSINAVTYGLEILCIIGCQKP